MFPQGCHAWVGAVEAGTIVVDFDQLVVPGTGPEILDACLTVRLVE